MPADAVRPPYRAVTAALVAAALAVATLTLWRQLPPPLWPSALLGPSPDGVAALLFRDAVLPRLVTAFLAGGGLALSGVICQAVLDNPLAAPSTLGVSAGAELALVAAAVILPGGVPGLGREGTAALGALAAMGFVGLVAARHRFSPAAVVLGGLAVGLFAGALWAALALLDREDSAAVFIWGAGSLAGAGPSTVAFLLPRLAALALAAGLMARPLAVLGVAEGAARGLGVPVLPLRVAALAVAALMAGTVTAAVGVIAFVELLAPALARASGARRLGAQLVHAPLIGGALLVLVDAAARGLEARLSVPVPAGAAAALFGAPALLVLALRLRGEPFRASGGGGGAPRHPAGPAPHAAAARAGGRPPRRRRGGVGGRAHRLGMGRARPRRGVGHGRGLARAADRLGARRRRPARRGRGAAAAPHRQPAGQPGNAGHRRRRHGGPRRGAARVRRGEPRGAVRRGARRRAARAAGRRLGRGCAAASRPSACCSSASRSAPCCSRC